MVGFDPITYGQQTSKSKRYTDAQISRNPLYIIVESLPETGNQRYIYLLPASSPSAGDYYEEYIWAVNGEVQQWEYIGSTAQTVVMQWGNITGTLSNQTDLQTALDQKLDANQAIIGDTKCKVTYDTNGLVTQGADLAQSDIPTLPQSKITNLETDLAGKQPTLTAGTNITIDGATISATDTTYSAGQNITINGTTISATDTTYTDATTSASGLMSASDKTKLNGIQAGAQVNPANYLKNATVDDDTLTITKQDDTTVTFQGGGGGASITIVSTDPTSATVGTVGAMQYNSVKGIMWVCTSATDGYTWQTTRPHIIERAITETS